MILHGLAQVQVDGLHITQPQAGGSEQTRLGPLDITHYEPQNMTEERFLAMLRFEQRGKLAELPDDLVRGRNASAFA